MDKYLERSAKFIMCKTYKIRSMKDTFNLNKDVMEITNVGGRIGILAGTETIYLHVYCNTKSRPRDYCIAHGFEEL